LQPILPENRTVEVAAEDLAMPRPIDTVRSAASRPEIPAESSTAKEEPEPAPLLPLLVPTRAAAAPTAFAPSPTTSRLPDSSGARSTIRITIGRIDVRANTPAPSAPPVARRNRAASGVSLSEYLKGSAARQR
jgi:hypothetical protein